MGMTPEALSPRRQHRLLAAFTALGIEPESVEPVTGSAPWSSQPRTFRVSTTVHGDLKFRLMRHEHRAARVEVLTEALGDPRVPALVGRHGATTVERWVEGAPMPERSPARDHVVAAADILGTLHRFRGVGRERLPHTRSLGQLRVRTTRGLDQLVERGLLSTAEATQLSRMADGLPAAGSWGVTHTDLGGDNLVVRPDGTVVSIDNEHLVRGFLDFDLARTWYRWPLPRSSWSAFLSAYERCSGREIATSTLRAWQVAAASIGVHRRVGVGAPVDEALARLRGVLDA
jgi:aminoglycoside phosphotransferase (APT) family kinase protein